jgi:hypothetical protein
MKFNKWTVALAALGVVSFASAAKAEEKASPVMTALAATTISGYVDTSAEWNPGTGNANLPPYRFGGASKADGFNLDVIQLRIEKPLDEQDWAAGYRADLWFGPDANTLGTQSILASGGPSDFAVRQAYVALRAPVGTGLDFKVGVFDSIIGYESIEAGNNPNFSRSYGHSIEPQTHTGVLASYRFCDALSASAGVADTVNSAINARGTDGSIGMTGGPLAPLWNRAYAAADMSPSDVQGYNSKAESSKSYMGSIALTAPDSMGFLSGSTLYGGIVNGFNGSVLGSGVGDNQTSYYVGATVATPVTGLRLGAAFDYLDLQKMNASTDSSDISANAHAASVAGYASYQATEKLSFHGRVEYTEAKLRASLYGDESADGFSGTAKIVALTGTVQYDLWKNVISRVEFRWDHSATGDDLFGGSTVGEPDRKNAFMLAANVIYKF